jgi:Glyoxalase-like domain
VSGSYTKRFGATLQLAIASEANAVEHDLRWVAVARSFGEFRRDTMAAVSHYSRVLKVVIDAPADLHDQELAFWRGALGQELPEIYSAEYHGALLRGHDLMLLMQRLESGAPRIHLDIHTNDLDAEVARLERLGAERVEQVQTWWVMRDPAGLLFCVLPMGSGSLNDENAQRWE